MDDVNIKVEKLTNDFNKAYNKLKIEEKNTKSIKLIKVSQSKEFWNDNISAQNVMKEISRIDSQIRPWLDLKNEVDEVHELIKLKDKSINDEISSQISNLEKRFNELKSDIKYSGSFDDHGAILSIYAGAGGTDAQDWTQMLFRMYKRWSDKNSMKLDIIVESPGEEAGLKSITLEIHGNFVYGKLKSEHGVHRLVRLSPYNADNLRQTSFAKVEVIPAIERDDELLIDDKDLKIDVFRSGGHGGQSVNTTDSAVRITHLPTGIVSVIQNERSQLQNKETAMTIIRSKLARLQEDQHKEKISELKGPNQSAEWGNQIRSYVLHPYKQVKDLRTKYESSDTESVLDGNIDKFIDAYLEQNLIN